MKKLFALITFAAVLNFSYAPATYAQDEAAEESTEMVAEEGIEAAAAEVTSEPEDAVEETPAEAAPAAIEETEEAPKSFHQTLKTKFIEGGAGGCCSFSIDSWSCALHRKNYLFEPCYWKLRQTFG